MTTMPTNKTIAKTQVISLKRIKQVKPDEKDVSLPKTVKPKHAFIRLGYACINMTLGGNGRGKNRICVNRTCIKRTRLANTDDWLFAEKIRPNFVDLLRILKWNEANGIRVYRMSSDMLPHYTNPDTPSYSLDPIRPLLKEIGDYAREHRHRLTFHPGQYTQLGSPTKSVYEKSVADLIMHADIMQAMGLDRHSVIVLHGGGIYMRGNTYTRNQLLSAKRVVLDRIRARFPKLPKYVRDRIVLENCEKCYSVTDLLPLCEDLNIPLVLDTHHHACYELYYERRREITNPAYKSKPQAPLAELIPRILQTWQRRDIRPKFHLSESRNNADYDTGDRIEPNSHHDYVYTIPDELHNIHLLGCPRLDIMIEAKCKDLAVQRLYKRYAWIGRINKRITHAEKA